MSSITSSRKSYTRLSSPLSPSMDVINCDSPSREKVFASQVRLSESSPRSISRHSLLIRVFVFVLLEFGFLALVSAALWRPIIPHLSATITEVKGAVTAIAIVWHALAVFAVKDILLNVFSAEWVAQYNGSQNLSLQELDRVSRLTTGIVDQAKHCASQRATHSFRLAFMSFLLLILLNALGPSAIGVGPVSYAYPSTVQVANLTLGVGVFYITDTLALHRANAVIQLEAVQNTTTVGFSVRQPNILIPWPSSDSMSDNTTMSYQSDVMRYNFSCTWKIPSITGLNTWMVEGGEWGPYLTRFNSLLSELAHSDPFIFPLERNNGSSPGTSPLSSFLFIGRNATPPSYLNLEDIPSLPLPCNTTQNPTYFHGRLRRCNPLLISVLTCDPQLEILPATVNATRSSLEATISSGAPTVKNIPTAAANTLFSTSLLSATSESSYASAIGSFSDVSRQLFLPNSPFDIKGENPLKPLSLQEINQNMNNVLASSAKAYISGYKPDYRNPRLSSFTTTNTSAVMEVQRLALVGSKPFLVASGVTVGLLVALLSALVAITRPEQLEGFDLENIVRRLQLNHHFNSGNNP